MTRSELIERIANKNPHLMLKDVERIVDVVFNKIISSLAKGDRGRVSRLWSFLCS